MKELDLILKSIKNKEVLPIYFFYGEEPYYIDVAVNLFEQRLLSEEEKAFNQTVVYGKDTSYQDIFSLARQYPMMGDKQLIIVKEAQDLFLGDNEAILIEKYAENPSPSTVLVFAYKYKKLDLRRKFVKVLISKNYIFKSEVVRDYHLVQWITDLCSKLKLKTSPKVPSLLAEYLGNDLSRIANELKKIKILLKENQIVDENVIQINIGISKEFNVFELQNALGTKDVSTAMKIAYFMGENPKNNPFVMLLSSLYNYFSNIIIYHTMIGQPQQEIANQLGIRPFFLKDYAIAAKNYPYKSSTRVISLLREFDMKGKGVGVVHMNDAELITELVYKILNIDHIKMKI